LSFLLDTNFVSELAKTRPKSKVIAWLGSVPSTDLFLSVITLGEIRKGIEKRQVSSPRDAARLDAWLTTLVLHYRSRLLPFDQDSADQWVDLLRGTPSASAGRLVCTGDRRQARDCFSSPVTRIRNSSAL
jgi:toxin FitB